MGVRTAAQVDAAIVKHVREYWSRHRMVVGSDPKTLPFEGELERLCSEEIAAVPATGIDLIDFIVTPGTGAR